VDRGYYSVRVHGAMRTRGALFCYSVFAARTRCGWDWCFASGSACCRVSGSACRRVSGSACRRVSGGGWRAVRRLELMRGAAHAPQRRACVHAHRLPRDNAPCRWRHSCCCWR
jgi:hypothetical protein